MNKIAKNVDKSDNISENIGERTRKIVICWKNMGNIHGKWEKTIEEWRNWDKIGQNGTK